MPSIQLVICMQLAQEKKKRIPVDVLYSLNYAFFFSTLGKREYVLLLLRFYVPLEVCKNNIISLHFSFKLAYEMK